MVMDTEVVGWATAFLAVFLAGETLNLAGTRKAAVSPLNSFRALRLLNYLACFAFAWSTLQLILALRREDREADARGAVGVGVGVGVRVLWLGSLTYLFGFLGVTFVDGVWEPTSPIHSPGSERFSDAWLLAGLRGLCLALASSAVLTIILLFISMDLLLLLSPPMLALHWVSPRRGMAVSTALAKYWVDPLFVGLALTARTKLMVDGVDEWMAAAGHQRSVVVSTHASRVDWLAMAHLLAAASPRRPRVAFVTEWITQLLPIIGWHRALCTLDFQVSHSLRREKMDLMKHVEGLRKVDAEGVLIACPEGHVVDPGHAGKAYVDQCSEFAKQAGYKGMDYLMTPRSQGMSTLAGHASAGEGGVVSVGIALTRDGKLLNGRLGDSNRVVLDLYSWLEGMFGSPTTVHLHIRPLDLKVTTKREEARHRLMEEWHRLDSELAHFDSCGCFSCTERRDMVELRPSCGLPVASALLHACLLAAVAWLTTGPTFLVWAAATLYAALVANFCFGHMILGYTADSLPFETTVKCLLLATADRHAGRQRKAVEVEGPNTGEATKHAAGASPCACE